jgi:hypothetical protein
MCRVSESIARQRSANQDCRIVQTYKWRQQSIALASFSGVFKWSSTDSPNSPGPCRPLRPDEWKDRAGSSPQSGEVDIAVAAASINTGDPRHEAGSWAAKNYGPQSRDEHLRTALAAQNGTPTIVFIVSLSAVRERPRPMPKLIDHPPSSTSIAPYSVCA